jgi:formimidoylglutamate deiminase
MPASRAAALYAARALLPQGWCDDVVLHWDAAGLLTEVTCGQAPAGWPRAAGPVIPGMPNLHSHAFQRAMAGLTETRSDPHDSFWSWRTLMYRFAARLQPQQLEAIARHLYVEMLQAGYTSVCEFHYVHHASSGQPYANPAEHAERLIAAAADAGIGLTLLPVLYQYSGFGAQPPLPQQARFIHTPESLLALLQDLRQRHPPHGALRYGAAPHSLRAVSPHSLEQLRTGLHQDDPGAPLHLHIAEQQAEVEACVAALGAPPVQWLLDHQPVDARWCLVHATHMTPAEYAALARSGAVAGLCPTTEANLGDGVFDAQRYLDAGGAWGIGSDSQASVCARAELRLLEYGQRLLQRSRNVLAAAHGGAHAAVADRLYPQAVSGGARAAGRPIDGLRVGQRADFLVLDADHPDLAERPAAQLLSGLVFCEHGASPIRDVYTGGQQVVSERVHRSQDTALQAYRAALRELLS